MLSFQFNIQISFSLLIILLLLFLPRSTRNIISSCSIRYVEHLFDLISYIGKNYNPAITTYSNKYVKYRLIILRDLSFTIVSHIKKFIKSVEETTSYQAIKQIKILIFNQLLISINLTILIIISFKQAKSINPNQFIHNQSFSYPQTY